MQHLGFCDLSRAMIDTFDPVRINVFDEFLVVGIDIAHETGVIAGVFGVNVVQLEIPVFLNETFRQ